MKLEEKVQVLKFCSAVFNTVFLILGLSIAGCAVWILFDDRNFLAVLSSVELQTVAGGLLVIGAVVVGVSAVGCIGAHGENRFFLLTYLAFLIVLVLGQLFVTLVLLIHRSKIEKSLDAAVDGIITNYGNSSESQDRLLDQVQHYGKCCGRTGPADWLKNSFIQSLSLTNLEVLPCSCFNSSCPDLPDFNKPFFGKGNNSYQEGCKEKIGDWLEENALTIVGMDISLMLIQVVQFVLAVYLYKAIGRRSSLKRTSPLIDADQADLDLTLDNLDYGEQNQGYVDPDGGYIDPTHPSCHPDNHNPIDLEPSQGYQ